MHFPAHAASILFLSIFGHRIGILDPQLCSNASINVKSERGKRGGGGEGTYVGHLTFHKNFWSKFPPWGPKIWSNQTRSNIPNLGKYYENHRTVEWAIIFTSSPHPLFVMCAILLTYQLNSSTKMGGATTKSGCGDDIKI